MATHQSAEKRHRQSIKRRARNRIVRAKVRVETKKFQSTLEQDDKTAITKELRAAESQLKKAAGKGVLKKKTADRRTSRLAKAAHKKLSAPR